MLPTQWFVLQLHGITVAGSFFFFFFLSVVRLCVSVMSIQHFVVAKAGCNWYLHDINIFPLSKIIIFDVIYDYDSFCVL